jgi:hypothetical protein
MSGSDWLLTIGLALTAIGAGVLAYRDLRRAIEARPRGGRLQLGEMPLLLHRPEAWVGFPLIVIGSLLQIVGVVVA